MYQRSIGQDTADLVVSTGEAVGAILSGTSFLARAVSLSSPKFAPQKEVESGIKTGPELNSGSFGPGAERGG